MFSDCICVKKFVKKEFSFQHFEGNRIIFCARGDVRNIFNLNFSSLNLMNIMIQNVVVSIYVPYLHTYKF